MPLFVFPKPLPPEPEPPVASPVPTATPARKRGSFFVSALIGFLLTTVVPAGAAGALVALVGPQEVEARIVEQLAQAEIAAGGIDLSVVWGGAYQRAIHDGQVHKLHDRDSAGLALTAAVVVRNEAASARRRDADPRGTRSAEIDATHQTISR